MAEAANIHISANPTSPNSTQPSTSVVFLDSKSIPRFKGNQRPGEIGFTPGPSISEYLDALEALFTKNSISDDGDKKRLLLLHAHPDSGCAYDILTKYNGKDYRDVSYEDIKRECRVAFTPTADMTLKKSLSNLLSPNLSLNVESFAHQLRINEKNIDSAVESFINRNDLNIGQAADTRTFETKLKEFCLFLIYSSVLTDSLYEKVFIKWAGGQPLHLLKLKLLTEVRKTSLNKDVFNVEDVNIINKRRPSSRPRRFMKARPADSRDKPHRISRKKFTRRVRALEDDDDRSQEDEERPHLKYLNEAEYTESDDEDHSEDPGEQSASEEDCDAMNERKAQTTYTCFNCGRTGHISRECPVRKCFNCSGIGHNSADCATKKPISDFRRAPKRNPTK